MKYIIKNINSYDDNILEHFYQQIHNYKKEKINKIILTHKRKQSIIGELLLKELIENNYDIKYENLKFKRNKYGKPIICNYNLYFNISHSYDYVITAISKNKIGIDIEKVRNTNINTIYQFATDKEIEYILSSTKNIEKRLFKIYTLKEAYLKMKGTNLSNIKNIEFTIDKNNNILCSDKKVKIKLINSISNYVITICEEKK